MKNLLLALTAIAALSTGLVGCQASGDGSSGVFAGANGNGSSGLDGNTGIDGTGNPTCASSGTCSNLDTGFPNDGSVGGSVVQNDGSGLASGDTEIAGSAVPGKFVCTQTLNIVYGATTKVGVNGLIGSDLEGLVNGLGGQGVTQALSSVHDKDLVIDGTFSTAAAFNFTAGAINVLTSVHSVDLNVFPAAGSVIEAGRYAVFAVSIPAGLLNGSAAPSISVTTFLNDVQQEPAMVYDATQLSLLGVDAYGNAYGFMGRKVTKPYDRAMLSLSGDVLSVYTGDALYAHELCVDGTIVGN